MVLGIKKETRTYYRGAGRVAQHCGCSTMHLAHVLRGTRKPSRRLREKLERIGVQLPEITPTAKVAAGQE